MKASMTPAAWKEKTKGIPWQTWHQAELRWNRAKGHLKKIPQKISGPSFIFLPKSDRKGYDKWKKGQNKDTFYSPHLSWIEVPQRLPYRKGDKDRGENPELIYYDPSFLALL